VLEDGPLLLPCYVVRSAYRSSATFHWTAPWTRSGHHLANVPSLRCVADAHRCPEFRTRSQASEVAQVSGSSSATCVTALLRALVLRGFPSGAKTPLNAGRSTTGGGGCGSRRSPRARASSRQHVLSRASAMPITTTPSAVHSSPSAQERPNDKPPGRSAPKWATRATVLTDTAPTP
jgi:hypothetical protein